MEPDDRALLIQLHATVTAHIQSATERQGAVVAKLDGISNHLDKLNGRLRETEQITAVFESLRIGDRLQSMEQNLARIKGVGAALAFAFSAGLGWLGWKR